MSYAFAGSLYPNESSMLDAIAEGWLSCQGIASIEEQREILGETSDIQMTRECILGWELHLSHSPDDCDEVPSHMEQCGYQFIDLTRAFKRLRKRLAEPNDKAA